MRQTLAILFISIAAFIKVDGYENLIELYFNATAENRSLKVPDDASQVQYIYVLGQ